MRTVQFFQKVCSSFLPKYVSACLNMQHWSRDLRGPDFAGPRPPAPARSVPAPAPQRLRIFNPRPARACYCPPAPPAKKPAVFSRCCYVSLARRIECSALEAHLRLNSDSSSHPPSTHTERKRIKINICCHVIVAEIYLSINEYETK